jgi:hypothetical protein
VVSQARRGDPEPLRRFIERAMRSDQCQTANLNYWAYWVGQIGETHHADDFMATAPPAWRGAGLLRRLLENLHPDDRMIDLYVHSIWSLLIGRASVLDGEPQLAASLLGHVEAIRAGAPLSAQSRTELDQLYYAARARQ